MTRRFRFAALAALAAAAVLASCGDADAPGPGDAPASTAAAPTVDITVPPPTTTPPKPDPSQPDVPLPAIPEGVDPATIGFVTAAIESLASTTGADPADIEVVGFEEVMWRDGSIGCPLPGMAYTQAIVDGTRVALELDGEIYLFHAAGTSDPFLCENPAEPLG